MAKVLLHSVSLDTNLQPVPNDPSEGKWFQGGYKLFTESALQDPFGVHALTQDPDAADFIIFTELGAASQGLFLEWVRHHPFVKKHREKCFLFDISDHPLPFLPGLYASLRRNLYNPSRTRTGYYLRVDENPFIDYRPLPENPAYLACFVGTIQRQPIRLALNRLPKDLFLVEDTSSFADQALLLDTPEQRKQRFWPHYADSLASSAFVLAPRGNGTGSIRLFEAMKMGRAPVIYADEWPYPERVDWAACSLKIPERDVLHTPDILKQHRSRAADLGRQARMEWEKYYSPQVIFHWLVEDCIAMRTARRIPEFIAGRLQWFNLLNPKIARQYLRSKTQIWHRHHRFLL